MNGIKKTFIDQQSLNRYLLILFDFNAEDYYNIENKLV